MNNQLYYQQYQELLFVVLEEVLATVCQEYDRSQGSLTTWINQVKRFQYRLIDLFPKAKAKAKHSFELGTAFPSKKRIDSQLYRKAENEKQWEAKKRIQDSIKNPLSLNQVFIGNEDEGIEAIELLTNENLANKNLEGLDLMIEQECLEDLQTLEEIKTVSQTEITFSLGDLNGIVIEAQQDYRKKNTNNSQNSWNDLWISYLENDPDNFFKNKVYKDRNGQLCPECNNHVVLQTVLLNDLKEGAIINQAHHKNWYNKLKLLENKFNVSVDTLYSNLRHSKRPHTIINYCWLNRCFGEV